MKNLTEENQEKLNCLLLNDSVIKGHLRKYIETGQEYPSLKFIQGLDRAQLVVELMQEDI